MSKKRDAKPDNVAPAAPAAPAAPEPAVRWHARRPVIPCPKCGLKRLPDTGMQAIKCLNTNGAFVLLECRACGHRFKAVRETGS